MKWSQLSGKLQALLCALVVVPVIEAAVWAFLKAVGGERRTVLVGVAAGTICAVYAFGPVHWLADPDIAGRFGRDHPRASRLICLFGVVVGFGVAVLSAIPGG